jgi:AraC-like DNA-binding protein
MHYYEVAPDPRLRPFVKCFWGLRVQDATPAQQRVLPDGCCELVLHFGDRFTQYQDGRRLSQPRELFVGPTARAIVIEPGREADVLGIRFRPGGAALVLNAPLAEVRDAAAACAEVEIRFGFDAIDVLAPRSDADRIAILERMLLARLDRTCLDPAVDRVQCAIMRTAGALRVQVLAQQAGISARQLQRRFREQVGLEPKTLARLARLQRALTLARQEQATLARVAALAGYADQAHFSRDFGEIAGISPSEFFRGAHSLNDLFFADASSP